MEWLIQNEVKKLTTESRVQLLQSEKKVRSTINAFRDKIEDWVRMAEQSLLQELQDIVHSHEQKIQELENSVCQREDESKMQLNRRLIMKRLAFQPVIVILETNENLENLLKQSSSLGTVKSVLSRPRTESTNSNILKSIITQDASYFIGRVSATRAEEQPRPKSENHANPEINYIIDKGDPEVYPYVDDVSSWLPVSNTVDKCANEKETITKTVERRRKKTLRKSVTVLLRERNSLEDIKEESIGHSEDDKLDGSEDYGDPSHKIGESEAKFILIGNNHKHDCDDARDQISESDSR